MFKKITTALLLLIATSFACAQFAGGDKPTSVAPDSVMPAGKIYVDNDTLPNRQGAFNADRIELVCEGTWMVAPCNTATTVPSRISYSANDGQFRVVCTFSHAAYDDPIVWPGQAGRTHLHLFFGNDSTRSTSDLDNMHTSGKSTCNGGTRNRSGYWVPALIYHCETAADIAGTGFSSGCNPARNGEIMGLAQDSNFYYKAAGGSAGSNAGGWGGTATQWPPAGFRMISGSATNTAALANVKRRFFCVRGVSDIDDWDHFPTTAQATAVGGCDEIKMLVGFDECWNGVDIDSPNHRSHVADRGSAGCSGADITEYDGTVVSGVNYPILFPQVAANIHYAASGNDLDFVRLASDLPRAEARLVHGVSFTAGSVAPTVGATITQGANTATVREVVITTGSFGGGTAAGTIVLTAAPAPGPFSAGALTGGGTATLSGASALSCTITENFCAGRSLHADWVNGWSPNEVTGLVGGDWGMSITDAIIQECYMVFNNPAVPLQSDCHNNLIGSPLGDGRWWSF
jgi:hypothetical protein